MDSFADQIGDEFRVRGCESNMDLLKTYGRFGYFLMFRELDSNISQSDADLRESIATHDKLKQHFQVQRQTN